MNVNTFGRITGGQDARPQSWSMVVSLKLNDGTHMCGGTILSDRHILTAAHCVAAVSDPKSMTIHAGMHDLSQPGAMIHQINRISIHPLYTNNSLYLHDLAIIHLESPLNLEQQPSLGMACVAMNSAIQQQYPATDAPLVAVGWGMRGANSTLTSNVLQQMPTRAVDITDASCAVSIDNEKYQFCARSVAVYGGTL